MLHACADLSRLQNFKSERVALLATAGRPKDTILEPKEPPTAAAARPYKHHLKFLHPGSWITLPVKCRILIHSSSQQ